MTPSERCSEITKELYAGGQPKDVWVVMMERLMTHHLSEVYRDGFQEAAEKAAKIVDDQESGRALQAIGCADAIRQLKPEGI